MKMQAMSLKLLCSIHFQTILLLLVVLLHIETLAVFGISIGTSTYFGGNETDHQALLAFKAKITRDPENVFSSWNDSLHFCEWEGVTCGRKHRRVTVLDLSTRGLVGSLSPYIGNLSFLREIALSNNTIGGKIPNEVGRLFRLQVLRFGNSSFEGEIPTNLSHCFNLKFLGVGGNKLSGSIPMELASLSKLELLAVRNNNLKGRIPSFIGNLSYLQQISAAYNVLQGHIPDALGQLRSLKYLGLANNKLSEYGLGSEVSTKGDVYSYGILLLEMITGKRPTNSVFEGGLNLHNYASMALPDGVMEIVDPKLLNNINEVLGNHNHSPTNKIEECLISMVKVGVACSMELPQERWDISKAISELHLVRDIILGARNMRGYKEGP